MGRTKDLAAQKLGLRNLQKRGLDFMIGKKGAAALEFAFVLPMLLVLGFGAIDFGKLIYARLIITNVSREGGSLACRFVSLDDPSTIDNLFAMLKQSGLPLDLGGSQGRIWISQIIAGQSADQPDPTVPYHQSTGGLDSGSAIITNGDHDYLGGLSDYLHERLVFHPGHGADLNSVWVVEVFYKYVPITPLPNFVTAIGTDGIALGSKAVFSGGT